MQATQAGVRDGWVYVKGPLPPFQTREAKTPIPDGA